MPCRSFHVSPFSCLQGFGTLPDKQKRKGNGRRVLTANDTVLAQHGTICLCLQKSSPNRVSFGKTVPRKPPKSTKTPKEKYPLLAFDKIQTSMKNGMVKLPSKF